MTGLASSVIRDKMIKIILSDKFPSVENCNIHYVPDKKVKIGIALFQYFI